MLKPVYMALLPVCLQTGKHSSKSRRPLVGLVRSFSLHLRHFSTYWYKMCKTQEKVCLLHPLCIYMDFSILVGVLVSCFYVCACKHQIPVSETGKLMRNLIFLPEENRTASIRRTSNTDGSIIADTTWTKWRISKTNMAAATRQNKLICSVIPAARCWHLTELCLQEAYSSDLSLSHTRCIFSCEKKYFCAADWARWVSPHRMWISLQRMDTFSFGIQFELCRLSPCERTHHPITTAVQDGSPQRQE